LRGISVLSAMVLLTELGDLRRFRHPRQLMAYVGIVPGERSSGESQKRMGITKTGNAHVRRILVEAAWGYRSTRTLRDHAKAANDDHLKSGQRG
jgi:transposase